MIHDPQEPDLEDELLLSLADPIRISERAYLNPNPAACGPKSAKLLSMILLAKGVEDNSSKGAPRGRRRSAH